MIKQILCAFFCIGLIFSVQAEKIKITVKQPVSNADKKFPKSQKEIPVEIIYNLETRNLIITCTEDIDAEVYLFNSYNEIVNYSPCLNCLMTLSDDDYHTILLQGNDWSASGSIE